MSKVLALILVLAVVTGVAVTTTVRPMTADFRFINRASVNTLDPAQMSYAQDIRVALGLWEGLTILDPKTIEPIAGAAFLPAKSADQRTYTFTIRPQARWSNGEALTAHDFVGAWRRAIEPGSSDVYSELILQYIDGAESYITWRTEFTALLGFVRQLQKGSPISATAARTALTSPAGRHFARQNRLEVPEPAPDTADSLWPRIVSQLRERNADWRQIGDALLDAHIAEMEQRWSQVGVRATDGSHLEVRLVRPTAYFLDLTAFSTYLPVHAGIERLRERYEGRPVTDAGLWSFDEQWTKPDYHRNGYPGLITNGPYRLAEWDFKQRMLLAANPHYWNAAAVCSKTIEIVDVEYQNTAWMLYDQGRIDLICELTMDFTPDLVSQRQTGKRDDIYAVPSFGTYHYNLNCRPYLADGRLNPLANAGVRRALALAVNKQELVDHVSRLGNPVANAFVPVDQIPNYRSPTGLSYNPQRARQELASAGHPGGKGLPTIEILYNTGSNHELFAQAIARMWERELGITCLLVGKETKTFAEDHAKGRFMVARSGWFGDYNDPTTFLNLCRANDGHNYSGFNDPKYDALLTEAAAERDPIKRLGILSRAEQYVVEDQMPILPVFTYVTVFAWRPNVTGIYPNSRLQLPLYCIAVRKK